MLLTLRETESPYSMTEGLAGAPVGCVTSWWAAVVGEHDGGENSHCQTGGQGEMGSRGPLAEA